MQCGSNLLAIFFAFDFGCGLVCCPRSGAGASGGVETSGAVRDELSCREEDEAGDCALAPTGTKRERKATTKTPSSFTARLYCPGRRVVRPASGFEMHGSSITPPSILQSRRNKGLSVL